MDKLEKFQKINQCETAAELEMAILDISENGIIGGRRKEFEARKLSTYVQGVINGMLPVNCLTREFGIRQQAIYLMFCAAKGI
jgi:hypothetical protein